MADIDAVCITVDTEWAHADVLSDTICLLRQAGVAATFFCTHPGISVPGHERAIHPNFRWDGDTVRGLLKGGGGSQSDFFRAIVRQSKRFCPEATGVRAHSLFYDSQLLPIYQSIGISYDSSYFLPLAERIRPVMKEYGILELPVYWMDHWHLVTNRSSFALAELALDRPGLKVFDFHPNLVFLNARSEEQYLESKRFYHDPGWLADHRWHGRGVRTLLLELLEWVNRRKTLNMTMQQVDRLWRSEVWP